MPAHNLHALSINNLTGVFLLVRKSNTIGILLYVAYDKGKKKLTKHGSHLCTKYTYR